MLTKKEISELREHLEQSQNPLFFFDNDQDGLCAFSILQRSLDRGRGVAVKGYLEENYFRKVNELNPDYIFILDKPAIEEEFFKLVEERGIPIVMIDHHPNEDPKRENLFFYNSQPSGEPTSYIVQKIFNRKEDLWISLMGCLSDVYKPDFAKSMEKEFPELYNSNLDAFDSIYQTDLGKLIIMLGFGLKDTTTNVMHLLHLMKKAINPYDLLEENSKTRKFHKKANELYNTLNKNIKRAGKVGDGKVFYYEYSGLTSMSSELSNYFMFHNPEKLIIIAFKREGFVNISIRGDGAKKFTEKIVSEIEGARGGGHELACGARIPIEGLDKLRELIEII